MIHVAMHRQLRKLLDDAVGEQAFVIAVNLDIRGFSAWSRRVESAQSSLYLKKVFPKLIDTYFHDDWFFKLTGDGLLLVRPFIETELPTLVDSTLRDSIEIVESFGSLCQHEPMVNFKVPDAVGIGIAQDAASRLVSNKLTLDYSGRVLNLASRLMELARPRGIVVDSGFGMGLIPQELDDRFESAIGYIRGVSPDEPVTIKYLTDVTKIPATFSHRPGDFTWERATETFTLAHLEKMGDTRWSFDLDETPADPGLVRVTYDHDAVDIKGRRLTGQRSIVNVDDFRYMVTAGRPEVDLRIAPIATSCAEDGLKPSWKIRIWVDYPVLGTSQHQLPGLTLPGPPPPEPTPTPSAQPTTAPRKPAAPRHTPDQPTVPKAS
jgi:hypothetical protein